MFRASPRLALVLLLVLLGTSRAADKPNLPRVLLVGDSIRLGYAPHVAASLKGKVEVISPKGAGDSAWVLKNIDELIRTHKPDVVHFNAGLHDLRLSRKGKTYQVPVAQYEKNLAGVIGRLKKHAGVIIFANTTPVHDERGKKRRGGFERRLADVETYNAAALKVMHKNSIVVHDLFTLMKQTNLDDTMSPDGTHFTKGGSVKLADAVADCVLRALATRHAAATPKAPDPKAGETYQKAEKERDAKVPAAFKKLKVPTLEIPGDAADWKKRRPKVLDAVVKSLGDLPKRPKPSARLISRELRSGYILESLTIPNGVDGTMTAMYLIPEKRQGKVPAIFWLHSSSYDRLQLLQQGHNGGKEPLGEVFVKAGYAVFAPDACWYGGRAGAGPAGDTETAFQQQQSLLKYNLWFGRTLWGMFVYDDQVALDYLCSRQEIDTKKIGATGISMGSTRSWWLAAVDERIACAVGVACLTRYQNLIAHGQLRQHGVYYFVNGLLKHFDVEGVLALIAPRPFLALTGDLDAGSPADGVRIIDREVSKLYHAIGAKGKFRSVLYKDVGHTYTPAMRKEMLTWFARWLKGEVKD